MKTILFLLLIGFINKGYCQDLEVSVLPINKSSTTYPNLFKVKILNNSLQPIAIKCSWHFLKYSETDTLSLAIGEWDSNDNVNFYYGIHGSKWDGNHCEPDPGHLIIINPQNYILTNVSLTDLSKHSGKSIYFSVYYTSSLSSEEIIKFSGKTKLIFGVISKYLSNSDSCSAIIDRVSYFWIKDSLANNGFRALSFQDFLKCKLDNLTPEYLMLKLGKPNKIQKTNHGIQYEYYYFDDRALPENEGSRPGACGYILFSFSKENKFIEVGEGQICY
jgi:hypothetical protein